MSDAEPPDVIGSDDTSFEEFVAGSSARLFTMARLLTGQPARPGPTSPKATRPD